MSVPYAIRCVCVPDVDVVAPVPWVVVDDDRSVVLGFLFLLL